MAVVAGMLSAASTSISMGGATALGSSDVIWVAGLVVGLITVFIAWLSAYRPSKRSKPLQVVAQGIERVYIDALEQSDLNPVGIREVARA